MEELKYEIRYELYQNGDVVVKKFATDDREIFEDMLKRFTVNPFTTILTSRVEDEVYGMAV